MLLIINNYFFNFHFLRWVQRYINKGLIFEFFLAVLTKREILNKPAVKQTKAKRSEKRNFTKKIV